MLEQDLTLYPCTYHFEGIIIIESAKYEIRFIFRSRIHLFVMYTLGSDEMTPIVIIRRAQSITIRDSLYFDQNIRRMQIQKKHECKNLLHCLEFQFYAPSFDDKQNLQRCPKR